MTKIRAPAVLIVFALAVGGIFAGGRLFGSQDEPDRLYIDDSPLPAGEVFTGELLGIHFGDEQSLATDGVARDDCPDAPQTG